MKKNDFTNAELASFIDHTCLKPDAVTKDIVRLCQEAKKFHFASVCVNPCYVKTAKERLKRSDVKVCTVIDFPLGQGVVTARGAEVIAALADGADELDFVMNVGLLKCDPVKLYTNLVADVFIARATAEKAGKDVVLKLIIECCNLTDIEKIAACKIAKRVGFDFVKTSTGFAKGGATVEDVKLMRKTIGRKMGLKAAGGIRTREDAVAMLNAGATRLGCSAGVAIVSG